MATFYDLAAANRRKSALLVLLVLGIFAALATAAGVAFTGGIEGALPYSLVAFGLGFVLTLGAWFGGDRAVLAASGAKPLDPSAGAEELQLDNITAELAIAANIPKPKIYVIDDTALNAFATGRDPQHALVAVNTGLLDELNKEELRGVLAHELAHIYNRDIFVNSVAAVCVRIVSAIANGFIFAGIAALTAPSAPGRKTKEEQDAENGQRAMGLGLLLIGALLAITFCDKPNSRVDGRSNGCEIYKRS